MEIPRSFLLGAGVLVVILLAVLLARRHERGTTPPEVVRKTASMVKESADAAFTAQQSDNPLVSLTRANYAMAYLKMARALARDEEIAASANLASLDELHEDIEREEQIARTRILESCPRLGRSSRLARQTGYGGTIPQTLVNLQEQVAPPTAVASALPASSFTRL